MRFKAGILFVLTLLITLPLQGRATDTLEPRHVLMINSYDQRMTWVKNIVKAVEDVLDPDNNSIVLHIANMDSKQFHSPTYFDSFKNHLKIKYKDLDFSLILSSDNNAFSFLKKNRDELFPEVPVVFCGVNDFTDDLLTGIRKFTGVAEIFSARRTVEMALKLHPGATDLFVVNDYLKTGRAWEKDIKTALQGLESRVRITYAGNLAMDELISEISRLEKTTIVLLGVYYADRNGKYFTYEKVGAMISEASRVPVYCLLEFNIGRGVVGGEVISGYYQGQAMAEIGKRVLSGVSPDAIPVQKKGVNRIVFDYRQLSRFTLDENDLPPGSTIINRPFSIYQEYKREIIGLSLAAAFLLITIVSLVINIARRIKAEKKLLKQKTFTDTALDSQQDTFVLFSTSTGKAVRWNRAFSEITGYSDREIASLEIPASYFGPDDLERATGFLEQVRQTGFGTIELELICRDGHRVPTEYSVSLFSDDDGVSAYFIAIGRDVTERVAAQDALRASHERFLKVLDSIDATIYVADFSTHEVLFVNRYMIEAFGDDATGKICYEVFRNESAPCAHCNNDQLFDEHGNPTDVCIWQARNPVTGKWYINYDRAIDWVDGRQVKLQIATDITEFKRIEEELRQAHKMESVGVLAGGIAHEFNNILSIIIGNTELALDDISQSNPAFSKIREIKTAVYRAKEVVSQLLSFSRKADKNHRPIDISPIVRESLKLMRSSIPAGIEIRQTLPESCAPILADQTQIHQVVINLCTNSAHAMVEEKGLIHVSVKEIVLTEHQPTAIKDLPPGNYITLTVTDTGVGIPPENEDKIFDPYFTTKEVGKGTGMGLAVVHGILKSHNAGITIESQPGRGATFRVYFPVSRETYRHLPSPHAQDQIVRGGAESILFVDDEQGIVNMAEKFFKERGYAISVQTNPEEALAEFKAAPDAFDIVVSDMTMPKLNGIELSKKIKHMNPDTPVIICTGYNTLLVQKDKKPSSIDAVAMKPVSMKEIEAVIRDVLNQKESPPGAR